MTPQETQVLDNFLTQLVQARVGAKDPQAEAMIATALAKQPDAAYLLVQRALLLDQALASAKAQISSLQNELQAVRSSNNAGSSFFDSPNTWGNSAASHPAAPPAAVAPVQAPPVQAVPAQPVPASRPGFLSGFGGTLGNIATTAAGVAGGALLFQGIENLFHHSSGNGFLAQPAWGTTPAGETTVINNYYERDSAPDDMRDTGSDSDFLDAGLSDDVDFTNDSSII